MKIAIDAMGGDFAPENIVKGVNLAKKRLFLLLLFFCARASCTPDSISIFVNF